MPKRKARRAKSARKAHGTAEARETAVDLGVKHFEEEVNALGDRLGKKGEEFRGRYYDAFGVAAPIISVLFSLLMLVLGIWALNFAALNTENAALFGIHDFFLSNIGIFFLIFLVSSFLSYFSKRYPRVYLAFSPFAVAFGITVFFWIFANAMYIAGIGNFALSNAADYVRGHLLGIFWAFSIVGYFVLFLRLLFCCIWEMGQGAIAAAPEPVSRKAGGPRRLYRSGNDRILGGVCGGIAEYLGVDPILIRLLWVVSIFVFGSGLLFYLLAWIIIPRNPDHKWK